MVEVTIHNSIRELDVAEWDEIVGEGCFFQTHSALSFLEQDLAGCRPRYLTFRTGEGRLAGHVAAYTMGTDLLIFSRGRLKAAVDRIRRLVPGCLTARVLECGCPLAPGNPLSLRKGVDFADVAGPLVRALDTIAAEEGIRLILMRDFREEEMSSLASLETLGFNRISNLPTTELEIRWASFDQYVAAMRSHHRVNLLRRLRIARRRGLTVRLRRDFSGLAEQLARQWRNVHDRAKEYRREQLGSEFYRGVEEALGRRCQLLEVLDGETLVAHALIAVDRATLAWLFFGRGDGEIRDGAYFLAMARIIELAIEERVERIEMGLTTYFAKLDVGARMVPLWMFLRFRGALFGGVLPSLYHFFNAVPEVRSKAVFKSQPAS
jgi:predicted N-acyltransferase